MQPVHAQRKAFRDFAEAVHAFSDDPGPFNLERYLAMSRALDEAHGRRIVRRTRRAPALR
jgi:hypothetical protein